MESIEQKINRFINELTLSDKEKSLANAFAKEFKNVNVSKVYTDINSLKDKLKSIITNKELSISDTIRYKNVSIVQKSNSIKDLERYIWNLVLAGDGQKVIK